MVEIYDEKIAKNVELEGIVSFIFHTNPRTQIILKSDVHIEGIPDEIIVFLYGECCVRKGDKIFLKGNILKFKEKYFQRECFFSSAMHFWNETLQFGYTHLSNKTITKKVEVNGTVSLVIGFIFKLKLDTPIEGLPDEIFVQNGGLVREGDKIFLKGNILKCNEKYFQKEYFLFSAKHFWNETLQYGYTHIDRRSY